jgi:hypothetical protein
VFHGVNPDMAANARSKKNVQGYEPVKEGIFFSCRKILGKRPIWKNWL